MLNTPPLSEVLATAGRAVARVMQGDSLTAALPGGRHPAVQDLVYGTLRDYGVGDYILGRLLRRPLSDPPVRAVLLCALRALRTERAAAQTVVDQAVAACAQLDHASAKGLVNAVLRNYLRQSPLLEQQALSDEIGRYRHPQWWIDHLRAAYPREWEVILKAGNGHPPMMLRINRRRTNRDDYLARLRSAGIAGVPAGALGVRLDQPRPVAAVPGFAEGDVSVQDAAAQLAAPLLDLRDGMRVLDACAAPGGKTGHMAEHAELDLVALDRDAERAGRIAQNLARLHLHAEVKIADATQSEQWWDGRPFDRILLDAPCTGSGVVRRHPDIKWLRRASDIGRFAGQQGRLLEALWRLLVPGGKLLYATCSVFPEENRLQIDDFAKRHSDVRCLPTSLPDAGQLLPGDQHDGFYYALLQKT